MQASEIVVKGVVLYNVHVASFFELSNRSFISKKLAGGFVLSNPYPTLIDPGPID